jgi:hypothetical protein
VRHDARGEIDASGGDHLVAGGWAYDARGDVWLELPPVPGAEDGLTTAVSVWAGDRLLVIGCPVGRDALGAWACLPGNR